MADFSLDADYIAREAADLAFGGGGFGGGIFGRQKKGRNALLDDAVVGKFLKDSVHAVNTFNLKSKSPTFGWPKLKFQYFAQITLNYNLRNLYINGYNGEIPLDQDIQLMIPMTSSVKMPTYRINTETLNQYNRKRISQKKVSFTPMSLTFYDTIENSALRFCQSCYEYYYKDGVDLYGDGERNHGFSNRAYEFVAPDYRNDIPVITKEFSDLFGFRLDKDKIPDYDPVSDYRYLIRKIEIFQIAKGTAISQVSVLNPVPTSLSQSGLSYQAGGEYCEFTMTFDYEVLDYQTARPVKADDELGKNRTIQRLMGHSKHLEIKYPAITPDEEGGDGGIWGKIKSSAFGKGVADFWEEAFPENTILGSYANQLASGLGDIGLNMFEDSSSYLAELPGMYAKAGVEAIFTGKFEVDTDPAAVFKGITDNALSNTKGEVIGESKIAGSNVANYFYEGISASVSDAFFGEEAQSSQVKEKPSSESKKEGE